MKRDRNHEGYHDPTACEAIRRVSSRQRPLIRRKTRSVHLTYTLSEVESFINAVKEIAR